MSLTWFYKLRSIAKGWYRFLFRKKSEMAKERLQICKGCELRKGRFCGECWCELDALSELTKEEGGECHHPNGNKWTGMHLRHEI